MVTALFFIGSFIGALFTFNGLRRRSLWLPALVAGELAIHHIVWQAVATALFIWAGALDHPLGWAALAMTILSWVGLLVMVGWAERAKPVLRAALDGVGRGIEPGPAPTIGDLVRARPRLPHGVEMVADVSYGPEPENLLDLHLPEEREGSHPVLLQIHGGGWRRGAKERDGRPLVFSMAKNGWVCVSIAYRLSPAATFPDHLIDVKRAIAWLRENIATFGGDPSFVAVTGGSAGGHLAALAALTPNEAAYQPGFEQADTTVQACVPLYGIHDLLDRNRNRYPWPFVEAIVMKVSPADDPAAWDRASPLTRVSPEAPPFFVLHGSHDYLVPPAESRQFVAALAPVSRRPVYYAELPGATHGFDVLHSLRSRHVVHAIGKFLGAVHAGNAASGVGEGRQRSD
ncbi:MAG: alpha/beta hydrolase fold domain-containing protein [Acidimicrobiia bacterium]|nr:alpha/beta hydrolase fold domain-containing protein [Acidimicrobiia bacterium]